MLDFDRIRRELEAPAAAPLHARVRGAIQAQILDGTLQPGTALPPERTIKKELGISRATVRQAIKSLIDDDLLKSIVGSGTFVQEPQEAHPHNTLIGVIVPDSNYYIYYSELASSLNYRLRNAGYRVDTSIHNEQYETLHEVVSSLLAQQVSAVVIAAPTEEKVQHELRKLRSQGVVVMLLTRYLENFTDVDYLGADNKRIGIDATNHLIELGHTNIVHVAASKTSTAHDRAYGYVEAMQAANLTPEMIIAPDEGQPLSPDLMAYVTIDDPAELWERVSRGEVTGIFSFSDQKTSWIQKEIRKFNLTIPEDLSVISVDNMPYADFFDTPLTTFALPGEEIGKQAAELLLRRLRGETFPPQRVLLPARFIERSSTAELNTAS